MNFLPCDAFSGSESELSELESLELESLKIPTSLFKLLKDLTNGFSFIIGDTVLGGAVTCDFDCGIEEDVIVEEGTGIDKVKSSFSPSMGRLPNDDCVEGMAEALKISFFFENIFFLFYNNSKTQHLLIIACSILSISIKHY